MSGSTSDVETVTSDGKKKKNFGGEGTLQKAFKLHYILLNLVSFEKNLKTKNN